MELKARMIRFQNLQQVTKLVFAGAILAASFSFPAVASPTRAPLRDRFENNLVLAIQPAQDIRLSPSQTGRKSCFDLAARTDPPDDDPSKPNGSGASR